MQTNSQDHAERETNTLLILKRNSEVFFQGLNLQIEKCLND